MRRNSRSRSEPVKKRLRKAGKGDGGSNVRHCRSSAAGTKGKNTRAARELSEALDQLTAASDVLRVISRSSGDLQPIFATMLATALQICEADFGNIYLWDGKMLQLAASRNTPPAFAEFRARSPIRNPATPTGRMIATKGPVHVVDLAAEKLYTERLDPGAIAAVELGAVRTFLSVPMLKDNELVGAFILCRQKRVSPFTGRQIALVTNFTGQAVIAIENARLLNELRQRTGELEKSLESLKRERNNKLMNLEALTASIAHEVRQPLAAIASNGGAALRFLGYASPNLDEVRSALSRMIKDSHRASDVFDSMRALFGRIEHPREAVDVNGIVVEVLEALRGDLKDHNVTLRVDLTSDMPPVMGHRGQLHEVFINLVTNAVEAMDSVEDDRRVLQVKTERHNGGAIIMAVEDSGPGINPNALENIFDAFVTTKPNGMGLGLAICRMITERHDGQLTAARVNPCGTVFRVTLPTATA